MGGGWGDESDSDDRVVWFSYHEDAGVKRRDDRIRGLEAALDAAESGRRAGVNQIQRLTAERDEAAGLLVTCGLVVDNSDGGHWSMRKGAFLARIGGGK